MFGQDYLAFKHYPSEEQVDHWLDQIWALAENTPFEVECLPEQEMRNHMGLYHMKEVQSVLFKPQGMDPFYGYWQPARSSPAPLLVHLPGYGAEMSAHPDLVAQGYTVLHINPLGYTTPFGPDLSKKRDDVWPVLPDTIKSKAQKGYKQWLVNTILAIQWAQRQQASLADRVSFFGTSQGGGCSLVLGSLYRHKGAHCVVADLPFLTHFPLGTQAMESYAYQLARDTLATLKNPSEGWHSLGFIDTLSHARRLSLPVLLTAAEKDRVCPPNTIEALYKILPDTRNLCLLRNVSHCYTAESIQLASAWFRLYA